MKLFLLAALSVAAFSAPPGLKLSPDLFAFDNGTGRDQKLPLDRQAEILARTGYGGMALFTGTKRIPEILQALDARKLRLLGIYVHCYVDDTGPRIEPGLADAIRQLAGRETMIVPTVQGHAKDAEQRAVDVIREVAGMAAQSNLRVCLYPHVNLYMETAADAIRLIRKSGKKNVSLVFNLYHNLVFHWNRCGGETPDFPAELQQALPYIGLVAIDGIDHKNAAQRIVRLDQGDYDVHPFLKTLNDLGYTGPVGLQGYSIKGDVAENLAGSMTAWKAHLRRLKGGE